MENPQDKKPLKLSLEDQALLDSVVSAFPSAPLTDEEFEKAQEISNSEYAIEDVVTWARARQDEQK